MSRLRTVRPKWALTMAQARTLVDSLPLLPKIIVGLALLTGLRRARSIGGTSTSSQAC